LKIKKTKKGSVKIREIRGWFQIFLCDERKGDSVMANHELLVSQLRQLLDRVPAALRSISDETASAGSGPDKW
jgi:hypothetical protein